ncbi:hypothetical protein R1sor_003596 [Riccia sorocarpa]|uniref:Reverse transcriptase domain-containing protein n=1 Tax=Riccia sorocarpa TaxID=122646 RepID=A0ABD3H4W9_9MARC
MEDRNANGKNSPVFNRSSIDVGANPFHVLAGVFETETEELSDQAEAEPENTKTGQLDEKELQQNEKVKNEDALSESEEENTQAKPQEISCDQHTVEPNETLASVSNKLHEALANECNKVEDSEVNQPSSPSETPSHIKLNATAWSDEPEDDEEQAPFLNSHSELNKAGEGDKNLNLATSGEEQVEGTSQTNLEVEDNGREQDNERDKTNGQLEKYSALLAAWQSGHTCSHNSLIFNSRRQGDQVTVGDSQAKTGTWRRLDIGRRSKDLEDTAAGEDSELDSEGEETWEENTLTKSPSSKILRKKPPDSAGTESGSKCLTRPAEFTDSTPDRGNQQKKRAPNDPKTHHKQLLFSQEIGSSWLARNLEIEEPIEQEDHPPDQAGEEEVSDLVSLPELLPELLEDATGLASMDALQREQDGDAVLLCHESLRIVERGVSGKGFVAWARIQTSVGVVGVISLHAPNDSRKRKEVWTWMRDLVADERWIVLGDFNMVESQEDSIGPSSVLKQDEKHSWDLCAGRTDMVDARLCATRCLGPHFTRQAWHRDRFDQSRLDRFYLSKHGEWVYHIRSVEHQGARALSDHVPIKMEVMLKEAEASTRPRRSYFKMEYKMLMKPEVLARAKGVWIDHPRWAKDKRKRWTLALGRIRKLLMDIRDEERRREEATRGTEERLEAARKRVHHDQSEEAKQLFEEAVTAQRRREHEEAERCRRRCKITWLKEDEAPTKYFFARLKAKHAQEEMAALEDASGRIIEDRKEILDKVHRFYEELYAAEVESEEMVENRRTVVVRINRRLTAAQNQLLEELPSEELITKIVMEMPKEKSPGIDGVMVEILRLGWEFMREDCFLMVHCVWDKKKLIGKDGKGVIKLIPKNDRRHLLQNWRPITLLTMTYKIIAKVIATRLKEMLPGIIDSQQTGFVAGRNIIDNILSLRLGHEWAQVTDQDVIFVKLDFMKAYDKVAHRFLWDTLSSMGMEEDTISRIKGLVVGGTSEVHVNGSFTEEIAIERGVRICITAEEGQFERLKAVIKEFENASGACLNLQKSIVMQLKPRDQPDCMGNTGCEIAGPGRSFKYLGVATSSPVDEKTITEEIVQKLMKKLKHWSNRLLSWPAKTILLRHVLAATPLYQLMSVGLCKDGLEELERLCRNFLWGWNEDGNPKHALVAWERIAQEKLNGGLGWTSFRTMSDELNVRLIGRILEGGSAEWIQLARSFILRTLRKGSYQRECSQWTVHESLVFLSLTRIDGSPTLSRIVGSWYKMRKQLRWKSEEGELDRSMSILQIKVLQQLAEGAGIGSLPTGRELGLLRRMGNSSRCNGAQP